jgi:nitrate reductase gamma subunit
MYEFVRGPLMWISFIIFIVGLSYQIYRLITLTRGKDIIRTGGDEESPPRISKFSWKHLVQKIKDWPVMRKGNILGTQPLLTFLTTVFHICLILTPLFLMAHNVLLFESWHFSLPSFAERTTDILTVIVLLGASIFLIRRLFVPRVRAISSLYDYLLLLITLAPFLTGFIAYHQMMDYETIIIAHILAGEIMLVAIGVTKLSHMIFYFFVRFFVGSEYSFRGGNRTWQY